MKKLLLPFIALALVAVALTAYAMGNRSESDRNLQKWQGAGISHYRYNLFISCFCVFNENMPLVIEVKDGEVVSMQFQNGKPIDPTFLELFNRYSTIDRLFSDLEANINGGADEVVVEYDPTYGFPIQVTIDYIQEAADDELYLTISEFEVLP